jgi:hypothetical protein
MGVTFGTPVTTGAFNNGVTPVVLAMSGVTSGQPIILNIFSNGTSNPPPTFSDTFATSYTYTLVNFLYNSAGAQCGFQFIATGGIGTSGTISMASNDSSHYYYGQAVACAGASTASGTAALRAGYTTNSGNATSQPSPTLTPEAGDGVVMNLVSSGATLSTSPSSPWVVTTLGSGLASMATYANAPASALTATWTVTSSKPFVTCGLVVAQPPPITNSGLLKFCTG